jgi:hypothetical protein
VTQRMRERLEFVYRLSVGIYSGGMESSERNLRFYCVCRPRAVPGVYLGVIS